MKDVYLNGKKIGTAPDWDHVRGEISLAALDLVRSSIGCPPGRDICHAANAVETEKAFVIDTQDRIAILRSVTETPSEAD